MNPTDLLHLIADLLSTAEYEGYEFDGGEGYMLHAHAPFTDPLGTEPFLDMIESSQTQVQVVDGALVIKALGAPAIRLVPEVVEECFVCSDNGIDRSAELEAAVAGDPYHVVEPCQKCGRPAIGEVGGHVLDPTNEPHLIAAYNKLNATPEARACGFNSTWSVATWCFNFDAMKSDSVDLGVYVWDMEHDDLFEVGITRVGSENPFSVIGRFKADDIDLAIAAARGMVPAVNHFNQNHPGKPWALNEETGEVEPRISFTVINESMGHAEVNIPPACHDLGKAHRWRATGDFSGEQFFECDACHARQSVERAERGYRRTEVLEAIKEYVDAADLDLDGSFAERCRIEGEDLVIDTMTGQRFMVRVAEVTR